MADDWQAGDLALCVMDGENTRKGQVFTVEAVQGPVHYRPGWGLPGGEAIALVFKEVRHPRNSFGRYISLRFRKIRPHTPDAEDAETIALLTGQPAKEPAT